MRVSRGLTSRARASVPEREGWGCGVTYLDFNASTPIDPRVLEAMMSSLSALFGNPSSVQHLTGQAAGSAIEGAREHVAALVGSATSDVIFTSGASEAITLAILGAVLADPSRPNLVVSAVEHKATFSAAELGVRLSGGELKVAPVDRSGIVDVDELKKLVDSSVALVAVMHANNETGAINPVQEVSEICKQSGSLLLVDATQSVGKLAVDMTDLGADILTFSSHKMYGPKGAGALVADRYVQRVLVPFFPGGGQERGLRGGTQDTAAIVGFGEAARISRAELQACADHAAGLVDRLLMQVREAVEDLEIVGPRTGRIPNTINLRFPGADAEAVMASMPDIEVSTGSACQAAVPMVSHVLLAMGLTWTEASECLRISVGRPTTEADIDHAAESIVRSVERVRGMTAE